MATNDPWLDWKWDVFSAQDAGSKYEKPGTSTGHFTLSASVDLHSNKPCYIVSSNGFAMPDCWKDDRMQFFPLGSKAPRNVPNLPLEPWSKTTEDTWMATANYLRALLHADPEVYHLVSVMYPEGSPELVYLLRVDNAVVGGSPLLVMHLQSHMGHIGIREDGTAHGGGHN